MFSFFRKIRNKNHVLDQGSLNLGTLKSSSSSSTSKVTVRSENEVSEDFKKDPCANSGIESDMTLLAEDYPCQSIVPVCYAEKDSTEIVSAVNPESTVGFIHNNDPAYEESPDEFCEALETIPVPGTNYDMLGLNSEYLDSPCLERENKDVVNRKYLVKPIDNNSLKDGIVQSMPTDKCKKMQEESEAAKFENLTRDVSLPSQFTYLTFKMDPDDAAQSTDNPLKILEERIFVLEGELKKKTERLEQLEVIISSDGDQMAQLEMLERFEADWIKERELLDNEREEELRMLQEALEEALEEKAELESKTLRDASRESQLLDDFEWKLGEIERDYKKKVSEAEKNTEDRVKREMAVEFQQLIDDKRDIDEKLSEIAHLKSYEAEVTQLRGLIHEQQRAIRVASRQIDQLRVNERLLQDDLNKIRAQGYTRKQQEEMEAKWEEKTQSECNRLRVELLATNEEEMLKAIRQVVREKDDQIAANKRQYECQQTALNHQITELKKMLQQREIIMNQKLEAARTASDRELWELRRQLSKAHDSHIEILEQLEKKHAEELEQCQLINGDSRVALEQLYDEKFQEKEVQHQSQLNALQSLIEEEKQEALIALGDHYRNQLESLQDHIANLQIKHSDSDRLKQEEINRLRNIISEQTEKLQALQLCEQRRLESQHSKDIDLNIASSSSESSSEEEEDQLGSTPPIGRSAGDGCSPSNSAAASQDNIRPCVAINSPIPANQADKYHFHGSIDMQCESSDYSNQICQGRNDIAMYCDDPEHLEATQIILEMHQVLADRDAELQRLTEEKRFYQLELIHWERNLALQRAGLPFTLMPDPFSTEILRGFSAPPVTKPRIHSAMQILPSAAMYDSRGASYEAYSPSVVSLSSEAQQQNQEQMISPLNYPPWSATEMKEQEMIALGHINPYLMQQGRRQPFNYSEDADDFGNNNDGFNTPL